MCVANLRLRCTTVHSVLTVALIIASRAYCRRPYKGSGGPRDPLSVGGLIESLVCADFAESLRQ